MKEVFKRVTVLVFLSLIFIKASAFHVYEHDENHAKNCKLCLFVIHNQLQGFIFTSENFTFTNTTVPKYANDSSQSTTLLFSKNFISFRLYSRPPPSS